MIRALVIAVVALAAYAALGIAVAHAPPGALDRAAAPLAGQATGLALIFTASCWWEALVALSVAILIVARRSRLWRTTAVSMVLTTLVGWRVSDALKNVFMRPRPPYWHLIREPSYSYASGHAMFATIVYGAWAVLIWRSDLPRPVRLTVAPLALAWAAAILWSRLALGAHYVTDLAGGVLLGVALLALRAAALAAWAGRRAGASAAA